MAPSPGSEGNGTATQPTTWMGNLDSSLSLATLGKGGPLAGMGIPPELGSFRHRFPPFPETDRHARRIRYASPRDSDSGWNEQPVSVWWRGRVVGTKGSDTQTLGLVSQILAGGNFLPFKAVALWAWGGQRHKEAGSPGLWRWCVFLDGRH